MSSLLCTTGSEILRGTMVVGLGGVVGPKPPSAPALCLSCCCWCCFPGVHGVPACSLARPPLITLPDFSAAAVAAAAVACCCCCCCCCCRWCCWVSARCRARQQPSSSGQHSSSRRVLMRVSQRCSPAPPAAAAWPGFEDGEANWQVPGVLAIAGGCAAPPELGASRAAGELLQGDDMKGAHACSTFAIICCCCCAVLAAACGALLPLAATAALSSSGTMPTALARRMSSSSSRERTHMAAGPKPGWLGCKLGRACRSHKCCSSCAK